MGRDGGGVGRGGAGQHLAGCPLSQHQYLASQQAAAAAAAEAVQFVAAVVALQLVNDNFNLPRIQSIQSDGNVIHFHQVPHHTMGNRFLP